MITSRRTVAMAGIIVVTAIMTPLTASVAQTSPTFGIDSSKLWPMFQTQPYLSLELSPQGRSPGQMATNPDAPVGTVVPNVGGKGGLHAGSGEGDGAGGSK